MAIDAPKLRRQLRLSLHCIAVAAMASPIAARANNYGESLGWQFRTSTDRVNQAALLDLIQKRRGGYYAPPIYHTTIDRQFNCSIAPVATGNQGYQSATANSPTVTGASSQASGNTSAATATDGHGAAIDTHQANAGTVSSGVVGATDSSVHGTASQALNSTQSNSGTQSASVASSSACTFAALN